MAIQIYNGRGELVWQAPKRLYSSGLHEVRWRGQDGNGREMASGVYYAQMQAKERTDSVRLALVR